MLVKGHVPRAHHRLYVINEAKNLKTDLRIIPGRLMSMLQPLDNVSTVKLASAHITNKSLTATIPFNINVAKY